MLQGVKLILEEGQVELPVIVWSDLDELRDEEGRIAIFVLSHAVLVTAEEFDDGLEEVRADVPNRISGQITRQKPPLASAMLRVCRVHHGRAALVGAQSLTERGRPARVVAAALLFIPSNALLDESAKLLTDWSR